MNSSFFNTISKISFFFFLLIILLCILLIPTFFLSPNISHDFIQTDSEYCWPIPGYTKITSPFGKRISPTAGASSFHKGIDIGAPEGTPLYALCDGEITFVDFLGGGRLYNYIIY